jgi:hypothetical protein
MLKIEVIMGVEIHQVLSKNPINSPCRRSNWDGQTPLQCDSSAQHLKDPIVSGLQQLLSQ